MAEAANKTTALSVLRRLREHGFEALFAGGCVRDMLLGLRCSDYDVASSATPDQVKKLFRHVLLVGAKFGVAMVIEHRRKVEVTTFRSDVSYSDGRRPDAVKFSTPKEDALRRDFTINGMFYDPIAAKVIDYVGGQEDLRAKVVRTIGKPQERFSEDYLRMIRAVRFATRLGFAIADETQRAIADLSDRITSISGERIFDELSKMLSRETAEQALQTLHRLGLARHILPKLFDAPLLWQSALQRVAVVAKRKNLELSLGALMLELPQRHIQQIIRRWGGSNELRDMLAWLSAHREDWRRAATMPLHELKRILAHSHVELLRVLWRVEERRLCNSTLHNRRIAIRIALIPPDQIAPPPLLTGDDLKAMGLSEGPRLGQIFRALYDAQLDEKIRNRQEAEEMLRQLQNQGK